MNKKFKPIYIPAVLSIIIIAIALFAAGAIIIGMYPEGGFSSQSYFVDGADFKSVVYFIVGVCCIGILIVFGIYAGIAIGAIWIIYCIYDLIACIIRDKRNKNKLNSPTDTRKDDDPW